MQEILNQINDLYNSMQKTNDNLLQREAELAGKKSSAEKKEAELMALERSLIAKDKILKKHEQVDLLQKSLIDKVSHLEAEMKKFEQDKKALENEKSALKTRTEKELADIAEQRRLIAAKDARLEEAKQKFEADKKNSLMAFIQKEIGSK
jgi:hypothetical protein